MPSTKHFRSFLGNIDQRMEKIYADIYVPIGESKIHLRNIPMALSREEGTWHPIGGYGCKC